MATTDDPAPEPITPDDFRVMLGNMTYVGIHPSNGWRARLFAELVNAYAAALARAEAAEASALADQQAAVDQFGRAEDATARAERAEARAAELERERDALIGYRIGEMTSGRYRVFGLHGMSSDREYDTEAEAIQDVRRCAGLDVTPGEVEQPGEQGQP